MKYEYLRIDDFSLMSLGITASDWVWLSRLPDVERREDYCCHFVLKGSLSHTLIALKWGPCFN